VVSLDLYTKSLIDLNLYQSTTAKGIDMRFKQNLLLTLIEVGFSNVMTIFFRNVLLMVRAMIARITEG
jgi:hypothetical protein